MSARALWVLTALLSASSASAAVDVSLLAGLKARSIGPAGMSGRIADVVVDPLRTHVMYVGAATGGLWKSTDAGLTWTPIFDDQPVASIGAIALDPSRPDVIWVGTGEGNLRNSVSVGDGIYRSLDGGRTFEHLGLEGTERIHRIHVHPRDPRTVYVAAVGKLWGDAAERGVFRTRDGGRSWEKILYVDERTGCGDLAMDPTNPDRLIAAMYEHRREPWTYTSGGPGSGLYLTLDGGEHWKRIDSRDGLPEGDLGRIGVAIAPSDPKRVYAYVEAKENRLYRSDDGGFTYRRTKAEDNVGNRPFYYADLRVDPKDPDRVYSLWSLVSVSDDGGDSFRVLMPWSSAHPDHHAMWIHPDDPDFLVEGNDGGVYISRDRGESWRFVGNLPVGQFYHVAVDTLTPYNVYGGMQDNGSWRGPSALFENGGIRNHHWQELSFGDGFDTRPMPDDPERGYSMSQEGYLNRWDRRTGEVRSIRPAPPEGVAKLRFNWNAALAQDPFDADVIYYGSQFVHRSADRGLSWTVISPDLTSNRPEWQRQDESGGLTPDVTGAENFTTLVAIAPSPLERGVIWTGSDDGRLHLTRDGGATWTSLESRLKGVPAHTWIPHVGPSPHDAGTAFVVLDNHRRSDLRTYVYEVTEYGRRARALSTEGVRGYALVIEQDPVREDLLYLGTEFGLHLSFDRGRTWQRFDHGVPTVSVMDLVVHPTRHDLVLGTHGRSIFVIDDIRPLRALDDSVTASALHLLPIGPAQQYVVGQTGAERFPGATEFRGENRPYGALIDLWASGGGLEHPDEEIRRAQARPPEAEPAAKARIEVLDASGERVRRFEAELHLGLNRVVWDLRSDPFRPMPRDDEEEDWWGTGSGPEVVPGRYTVVVRWDGHEQRAELVVRADPREPFDAAAREANWQTRRRAGRVQEVLTTAMQRLQDTREDLDAIDARVARVRREAKIGGAEFEKGAEPFAALEKESKALREKIDALEKELRVPPRTKGYVGGVTAWGELRQATSFLGSTRDRPSPAAIEHLGRAEELTAAAVEKVNALLAGEVAEFRAKAMSQKELELFPSAPALELPAP